MLSKEQNDILNKIGLLAPDGSIKMLPIKFYKDLTDVQFVIFWNLPGHINIGIPSKVTLKYIKDRAKQLNLIESERSGFNLHEKKINGKAKK